MGKSLASDFHFFKGLHHFQQGEVEDGLREFQIAADIAKDSKETLNNIGSALAEFGFFAEAKRLFERAIDIYPDYQMAQVNLARVMERGESSPMGGSIAPPLPTPPVGLPSGPGLAHQHHHHHHGAAGGGFSLLGPNVNLPSPRQGMP
jgi:tetratricopeptide (TPR) repeat protein